MAVDDVCVIRVVGRYQQQNIVNTLHLQITAQVSNEDEILDQLLTQFDSDIRVAWLACHIDTYEIIGLKAFRVDGAAKVPAYSNIGANGTVAGAEVPSNVCRTITLYTDSTNHRRRGRVMLSGSEQAMFNDTDGSITVAAVGILQTLGNLFDSGHSIDGDVFKYVLPATDLLPVVDVVKSVGRVTPSSVKSRRVSQYLIG